MTLLRRGKQGKNPDHYYHFSWLRYSRASYMFVQMFITWSKYNIKIILQKIKVFTASQPQRQSIKATVLLCYKQL